MQHSLTPSRHNWRRYCFKEHFIIDLSRDVNIFVSSHHRRNARKALRHVCVESCHNPTQFTNEWIELYTTLIGRHNIKGIPAFSEESFVKQLGVPGIVMFRATHKEIIVGMTLWYVQEDRGYYHLGAYSDVGYELSASFGLFWFSIEYFTTNGLRWLDLGAGAGTTSNSMDGLTRFKRGWSTGTRTAYFCGRIFDHVRYSEIVNARNATETRHFPAYRMGEFG
jgi:hypothetical protein